MPVSAQLAEYPFRSNFFDLPHLPAGENRLHYIDEGPRTDSAIVCLHGNPTWSFYYRKVISHFSPQRRVIAPDHIGSGLSSKPQEHFDYRLVDHIDNLETLLENLGIKKATLIVHDWGGAIGLGWAVRHPERVAKVVLLNTAAFISHDVPRRIAMLRNPLGYWAIRQLNAFAQSAGILATAKTLSANARRGLLFPYDSFANRIGIARFVADIPVSAEHPTHATVAEIERQLPTLRMPKQLIWGMKDFCFHPGFLERWRRIYPDARCLQLQDAGHYVLEDASEAVIREISDFLQA